MSTKISFYGGVKEIGGNKILIEDKSSDASIFLDFGMNFTRTAEFFEDYLKPRTANGMMDYLKMGVIPWIDSFYRKDLLKHAKKDVHDKPIVDAIILSHAHLDHSSHISFVDERISIYCSEVTYHILRVIHETQQRSIDSELLDFKKRPILDPREGPVSRNFFYDKKKFKVHGIDIELIPVDHSIPGACGMLIHTSDKTIAYSGDFRLHGTQGYLTQEFIEKMKIYKPDIFLCEGTRIDVEDKHGEAYVKVNSDKAISETKGIVVADYAWKDITRFKTFFNIAKDNSRKFCISFREAYYIQQLKEFMPDLPDLKDSSILLYKKKSGTGTYLTSDYNKNERSFLEYENTVTADYVHENQNEIIIELGYFTLNELIDIVPSNGSLYIKSASEAINEEQQFDVNRLRRWLNHFQMKYENLHASGHAPKEDLKMMMEQSGAKTIMPIHTEYPEMYAPLIKYSIDIKLPELS